MNLGTEQRIENGSGNIQTQGDVTITQNYFGAYHPIGVRFYENDICLVLIEFDKYMEGYEHLENDCEIEEFERIGKPEKNRLNNLSEDYFQTICDEYLPYFKKVENFLRAPKNKAYLKLYRKTALQLQFRIGVLRKRFEYFEEVLSCILDEVIANEESEIVQNIDLFIIFMNYMYWHCDIGRRK